ncbi:hypothetical protein JCM10213_009284 [Rhodosporidiobolus nylandii]
MPLSHDDRRTLDDAGYGMGRSADAFEQWREEEYPALKDQVYLDHAASPPAPLSTIQCFTALLQSQLLTNPHSASTPAVQTSLHIDAVRARVLSELFGVRTEDLGRWDVVFTAGGATQGIRTVGEAWGWKSEAKMGGKPGLSYLVESHTSLVGLRGIALSCSSPVTVHPTPTAFLRSALSSPPSSHPTLYTYPAQCNATGARLGLRFCGQIKRADPSAVVLVDAAAYCSTEVLDLGSVTEEDAPDYVVASAYKIFGWPTSLGLLVVKRSSAHHLAHGSYFGGGSISSLSLSAPFMHTPRSSAASPPVPTFPPSAASPSAAVERPIHETLEMGTPPFLEIAALGCALDWLQEVTHGEGLRGVGRHTRALRALASERLRGLRHAPLPGGKAGEIIVEHSAFLPLPSDEEAGEPLPPDLRVSLEPSGPTLGFTLLPPSSSLSASSFPLSPSTPSDVDYRQETVGHAHLARLAVVSGISIRTGGMCNTGVWASVNGVEDAELQEMAERGRKCWDDEEFSPLPPYRPIGLSRISFGLSSTATDVLAFVDFVKKFFVRTEEVAAALEVGSSEGKEEGSKRARVKEVLLYPIKSCSSHSVPPSQAWPLTPTGLLYDREFMLVSASTGRCLSQKRYPRMALIRPEVDLAAGLLTVRAKGIEDLILPLPLLYGCEGGAQTPPLSAGGGSEDGHSACSASSASTAAEEGSATPTVLCGTTVLSSRISSLADAWFTSFLNPLSSSSPSVPGPGPVELRRLPPGSARHGHFDAADGRPAAPLPLRLSNESPFLMVSEESLMEVGRWIEAGSSSSSPVGAAKRVKAIAFRPNLVVGGADAGELEPFWEDRVGVLSVSSLVSEGKDGEGVRDGERVVFATLGRCRRCLMVAVDQETGLKTAEPLASLSQHRKNPQSGRVEFGVHLHLRDDLSSTGGPEGYGRVRVGDEVVFPLA